MNKKFICIVKKGGVKILENGVTIIIPVYNAKDYLRECLESLKNQTYKNYRAVLIDDCSKDNSFEIINEFKENDDRFIYIKQPQNMGASAARNTGLENVTTEYTTFLDADDYWENTTLEEMVFAAKKYNADVVQCRFIYDFPGGKKILPSPAFKKDIFLKGKGLKKVYMKMLTGINMNHVCMKLIKSEILEGIKFDTGLKTAEDLDFSISFFKNVKSYFFLNKVFYHYRRSENSITGRGLPFKVRFLANKKMSEKMVEALPFWEMDNIFYKCLAYLRPYVIIVSKVFRIIREKIASRREEK